MKSKKILIASLLLATAACVAYCSTSSLESANNFGLKMLGTSGFESNYDPLANIAWIQKYPQLAGIESNNQTAVIDKLRTSESISQLIGPITNAYGIRDDMLVMIINTIPSTNPQLLKVVIKYAYYGNLLSFAPTDKEKLSYSAKFSIASYCSLVWDEYYNNSDTSISDNIPTKYDAIMRDTPKRKAYQEHLEQTVFAWQLLGAIDGGTKKQCLEGNY